MVKMNLTNNQTSFEYALYMIASSYFDKAECRNIFLERNMLLKYREQKLDSQYKMEDICIDYMDKLYEKLPADFLKQKIRVHLSKRKDGTTDILFVSRNYILELFGIYAGKKSVIECRFWVKSPEYRMKSA